MNHQTQQTEAVPNGLPGFRPYVYGATLGRPSPTTATGALGALREIKRAEAEAAARRRPAVTVMTPEQRKESQAAERARREAGRCPDCEEPAPDHLAGCARVRLPDPDAERCPCGYVAGSLGCRITHGGEA